VGSVAAIRAALRRGLARCANPSRARAVQAYLKTAERCRGVGTDERRALVRELWAAHAPRSAAAFRAQVAGLWDGAASRDERWAALDWCDLALKRDRSAACDGAPLTDLGALRLFERLIVEGAWWDLVDGIATHQLGFLIERHPAAAKRAMRAWSRSDDLWKRRSSIICQVAIRERFDARLLADCIAPSIGSREFFLRKAIGWALRQRAKHDPRWVRAYVRARSGELAPLSRREALRHL
jgi:3-methyladenine DNA glycosylase AlkD